MKKWDNMADKAEPAERTPQAEAHAQQRKALLGVFRLQLGKGHVLDKFFTFYFLTFLEKGFEI